MREIPDYTLYMNWSQDQLLRRLGIVHRELSLLGQEVGICESEKTKARAEAILRSTSNSAATRNHEIEVATVTLAATELELRADYATLLEEKFYIIRLLDALNDNTNPNFN